MHHKLYILINQRDSTVRSQFYFILLQDHSTCFGCCPHPSAGVHKTVTTASGTSHISLQLPSSNVAKLTWPHPSSGVHKTVTTASGTSPIPLQLPSSNVAKLTWPHPSSGVHKTVTTASGTGHISLQLPSSNDIWPVPEAAVTVLCTPDHGYGQHPKHVEWSCSKIK